MHEQPYLTKITIVGESVHSGIQRVSVEIAGDGSIEYMISVFQTALVAAGFSIDTAGRLEVTPPIQ
jgi:hypothetical protein